MSSEPHLTAAQRKWLASLAETTSLSRPYHDNFRTFDRVMERLCGLGYARPYVHGGYEITDAGLARLITEKGTT